MKDERRRYFRIEDDAILTWRRITLQEKEQGLARIQRGEIDYPDTAGFFLSMEADLMDVIHSLAKQLVLLPERIYILCYAVVVDCLPIERQTEESTTIYRMNVDFMTIRDEDIERLIQHIMRKEVAFLRARRKSRQND